MGTMPYNLVYGIEAIMPFELEISSFQVSLKGLIDDETCQYNHLHQLDFLNEH
jgi:hypothetical protein